MDSQLIGQEGYGAFSISKVDLNDVQKYIQTQKELHRKVSFQEEYIEILESKNIPCDHRYIRT